MKSNLITNLTIKQYEKKYRDYKKHLYSFTKQEVLDFDKQANTIGEKYVLTKRRWALIGDTYYEIPKPIRPMWFKGLSVAGKLAACIIPVGVAGALGGAGYGIYYAVSQNSKSKSDGVSVEIIGDAKDFIETPTFTKNSDGDLVTTIKFKGSHTKSEIDTKKSTIELDGKVLTLKTDYIINSKTFELTIYKSAIKSDNPKIKINIVKKGEEGGQVTSDEWNAAINYLLANTSLEEKKTRNCYVEYTCTSYEDKELIYVNGFNEKNFYNDETSSPIFKQYNSNDQFIYENSSDTENKWEVNEQRMFNIDVILWSYNFKNFINKINDFNFKDGAYIYYNDLYKYTIAIKFDENKKISNYHLTDTDGYDAEIKFSKYGSVTFDVPDFPTNKRLGFDVRSVELNRSEATTSEINLYIIGHGQDDLPTDLTVTLSAQDIVNYQRNGHVIKITSLSQEGEVTLTAKSNGYEDAICKVHVY